MVVQHLKADDYDNSCVRLILGGVDASHSDDAQERGRYYECIASYDGDAIAWEG